MISPFSSLRPTGGFLLGLLAWSLGAAPAPATEPTPVRDLQSDTWAATDGLGRVLPDATEAGPPQPDRTVGLFYFLTLDAHVKDGGPYDNTEILRDHPEAIKDFNDPVWGPSNAAHHWGEPLFGYYASDDPAILHKHAQMLAAAGVDVLIFDVSNAVTYDPAWTALCEVFTDIRRHGGQTPQIAFLCPFSNWRGIGINTLRHLYDTLYAPGRYADLWFRWRGKPLILGDPAWVPPGAPEHDRTMLNFFNFRNPIALYNVSSPAPGTWAWLQVYPQALQRDPAGKPEEVSVSVAQNYNATVNNTAPMSAPGAFGRSWHGGHLDTRPDAVNLGLNFAEQWERVLQVDPPFVFVTGWNEWTAGFYESWTRWHAPPPVFVDEFTQEYSRDIEPMKGGHGDDYYYQFVDYLRRYKGVRTLPAVTEKTIPPGGGFEAWKTVTPEFRDAVGDPVHRDHPGYGKAGPYRNDTGRNDIVAAKVCHDRTNVYFYVRTEDALTPFTDPQWMMLFIDADADARTGWLGYDFVINRLTPKDGKATLERQASGDGYRWEAPAAVSFQTRGNELEVTVPLALLGIDGSKDATVDFKWADHCIQKEDWTDFTLNGDAAPDDRFNYRARLVFAPK